MNIRYTSYSSGYTIESSITGLLGEGKQGSVHSLNNTKFVVKQMNIKPDRYSTYASAYNELNALSHLGMLEGYLRKDDSIFIVMKKQPGIALSPKDAEILLEDPGAMSEQGQKLNADFEKNCPLYRKAIIDLEVAGIRHHDLNLGNILIDEKAQKAHIVDYSLSSFHHGWPIVTPLIGAFVNSEPAVVQTNIVYQRNNLSEMASFLLKQPVYTLLTIAFGISLFLNYSFLGFIAMFALWSLACSQIGAALFNIDATHVHQVVNNTNDRPKAQLFGSLVMAVIALGFIYFTIPTQLYFFGLGQSILSNGILSTITPLFATYTAAITFLSEVYVLRHCICVAPAFLFQSIKIYLPYRFWNAYTEFRFNPDYQISPFFKRLFNKAPVNMAGSKGHETSSSDRDDIPLVPA